MTKKQEQLGWLGELFPTFGKIAQAIVANSVTVSEDAVSNAMEIVMKSVKRGNTAQTKGHFAAYCRKVVRGCAMKSYFTYGGDVVIDHAARNAEWYARPDTRHTSVPNSDAFDEEFDPFMRTETLESPKNE
jgi:hypothetical protein